MLGLPTGDDYNGLGQFFLLLVYGYILFEAAVLIGDGSEKLLLIFGPGIVGGLIIPVLGAVPDGAIVLVSGLGSNAQSQVSIGVGTLAGSTIMLLTIPWGARDYDPKTGQAARKKPKFTGYDLKTTVVTTYDNTPAGAKIMMMTSVTYLIITIPAIIYRNQSDETHKEHIPALIGTIVCGLAFIGYSVYQLYDSNAQAIQEKKQQKLKLAAWERQVGNKFGKTGQALKTVFDQFDSDKSGTIDKKELKQGFEVIGLPITNKQVEEIMKNMDTDGDETLTFDEFKVAIDKWFNASQEQKNKQLQEIQNNDINDNTTELQPLKSKDSLMLYDDVNAFDEEEDEEDEEEEELTPQQLLMSAGWMLGLGTLLVVVFSDPMVDVIDAFSDTISIPAFYVSFVVTPLASNASEIYSALVFAKKKTREGISMGFSSLYGAACMNNTFVLCVFCLIIYIQKLEWKFITETLVIILTIFVVGIIGLKPTVFLWQAIIVISMFPITLALVAGLQHVLDD